MDSKPLLIDPELARGLLAWYRVQARDLPWRRTRDPYAIWVSEVMLQQTQVATVIPYYERWMRRFPTVRDLAEADEQDVLGVWQGLGYYRRAKMLLSGARFLKECGMPTGSKHWLAVPGVGKYTASAISSIAFEEPVPVVDGNVERVFARLTGNSSTKPQLPREAWLWVEANLNREQPGQWNQALMELGATICRPRDPACTQCPLRSECVAFAEGLVNVLPVPAVKPATVPLDHFVYIPVHGDRLGVRQIPSGQWWARMWEFPNEEGAEETTFLGKVRHSVTHHRITLHVSLCNCHHPCPKLHWLTRSELDTLPMPSLQRKALKLFDARPVCLPA